MEFFTEGMWLIWMIAAIFFLIIEIVTTALVSIWFVPAAIITCILSIFIKSIPVQILFFVALSAAFMYIFGRVYRSKLRREKDDLQLKQQLLNRKAVAVERIDENNGKISVGDVFWKAQSCDGSIIESGQRVIIKEIKGTTVLVKKG